MKLSGASNEFFHCFMRDEGSFCIKLNVVFKEKPQIGQLKRAANDAMRLFPEFAVRPVIRNNRLVMLQNDAELRFCDEPGEIKYFGTEDTNGYLIYFVCGEKDLTLFFNHGLTDAVGITAYMKSLLTLYAEYTGRAVTDQALLSSVRTPSSPKLCENAEDAFDPYRLYGNVNAVPEWRFENKGAFSIPVPLFDSSENSVREILVDIRTSDFIRATKELGASFTPLMIDVASQAVYRNYDTGDDDYVSMLPVDLRRFFGSKTMVNFSDGISVPGYREKTIPDVAARCAAMKDVMKKQMTKAYFENLIGGKAAAVDGFFANESDLRSRPLPAPAAGKKPYTLPFSYPGRITFGDALDELLADASITGFSRVNSIICHTFGDKMEFSFVWRSNDISYIGYFCDELRRYGFEPRIKDDRYFKRDLFSYKKIAVE